MPAPSKTVTATCRLRARATDGSRFSASYVDQFADNTIGLALGYAHLDSPGQAKKYGAWAFGDYNGQWGAAAGGVPFADGSEPATTGDPLRHKTARCSSRASSPAPPPASRREMARWASWSSSRTTASAALSTSTTRSSSRTASGTTGWATSACGAAGPSSATSVPKMVDGNTIIDSGTVSGSQSLVYDKNWDRSDKIRSIGWRNKLDFSDQWRGTLDVGYSRADRDETLHPVRREGERTQFVEFLQLRRTRPHVLVHPAGPDRSEHRAADE